MMRLRSGGAGGAGKAVLSSSASMRTVCVLVVAMVALIGTVTGADDAPAGEEVMCFLNPPETSCDKNKLRYSVVLDAKHGEKFIINHSIERVPPSKPTKKPRRAKRPPKVGPDGEIVSMFPLWHEKMGAWKEKMRVLVAKRRAKLRRQRNRIRQRARL